MRGGLGGGRYRGHILKELMMGGGRYRACPAGVDDGWGSL